jgi:hypothetical protein
MQVSLAYAKPTSEVIKEEDGTIGEFRVIYHDIIQSYLSHRPSYYNRYTVEIFLKDLLKWADKLFRQNTDESIPNDVHGFIRWLP